MKHILKALQGSLSLFAVFFGTYTGRLTFKNQEVLKGYLNKLFDIKRPKSTPLQNISLSKFF